MPLLASAISNDLGWCFTALLVFFAMALNARTRVISRNAALDAAYDVLNAGFLRIYDGAQPATPETAISTQVMLAQLGLNATAFAAAASASKSANAITSGTAAATGTAAWGALVLSSGTIRVLDFEVGTSGANLNLNSVGISAGATVACSAFTISQAIQ